LNPEGLSINYNPDKGSLNLFVYTGYFWVEERKTTSDAMLIGFQGGLKTKLSNTTSFLAGSGYYNYTSTKGEPTFFDPIKSFGNTVDGEGHTFGFSFQIGKNAKAGVTYLLNKKGLKNGKIYNRLQVDLNVKI